ncbi:cation channel family protein (macronuclear) [Tetrahymena thermophila SB210]|uniref:Cation channel family protein n=1 Tax=Tetrahymena thermophila (strain SB210) TaxID=312017 RepID=I7MG36_TETTS|nr:cation channel family protein [Tetrahymena thermophila SB210]EAR84834.2 cation channel family protein [Tetrahymena thermophila SB210]|eukprot:XP_001032497.2 cation channel family protein [Tetrahymena thermophila SB210]
MLETESSKPLQVKRQTSEEILQQMASKNKIKKSVSLKNKNSIARLRIFNEQGIQQNEEVFTEPNKKTSLQEIYGSQLQFKKTSQSQYLNTQQNSQNFQQSNQNIGQDLSQQDEKEKSNKFLNLIAQLKMKKIAKNFINNLPLRRFQFLKSKQYSLINDKSTDKNLEKSQQLIEETQKKTTNKTLDRLRKFIPVFQPQNKYKLSWDMLQIIGIITFMFTIPIHLSNNILLEEIISIYFLKTLVIILSFDIAVNFNTGFFEKGELITSRTRIAQNYIKNMLFVDLMSIIPLIAYFLKHQNSVSITSFFLLSFFCKIRCFTRIFRKLEEIIRMQHVALNLLQLFKLLSTTLIFTHIFSCIWIYTGENTGQQNNWISYSRLQDEEWYIIYLKAYYFVTVTMVTVGYGDIVPVNYIEILITIIIMLISCGIFAYALNQIGIIFEELQSQSRQSQKYFMILNNYMEQRNISFSLQYQIREYLDYYWKESKQNKSQLEQQILSQLSETLKQRLLIEANKIILKDSPIFNYNFTDKLLQKTLPLIQEMHCTPEQIIFSQNQVDHHDIYFIEKGKIELFTIINQKKRNNSGLHKSLKVLEKGSSFGEQSFFTGTERKISARSLDFTKLLYIRRQDFIDLLKEFPQDNESFCMIKDLVSSGQYEKIGLKCYCCDNSTKHSYVECPYIHYIPDKYKIIKMEYSTHQQRQKKDRRKQFKERALNELGRNTYKIQDFIEKNQEYLAKQSTEDSQDDYCIQEYTDENSSSQEYENSIKSDESSELMSESEMSVGREKENLENLQKKESPKSFTSKKENQQQSDGQDFHIQFSNFDHINQDDQITFMQVPTQNKIQSIEKSPSSVNKLQIYKDSQNKSVSKKGGVLSNFQKLKYNKPNQQIINGTVDPSQEIDSPMAQYRQSKNFQFSQFKNKKKINHFEQNQIPYSLHDNSITSSNNEMKSTPTLRKNISKNKNNNQIPSTSPQLQNRISSKRKSDKAAHMQKESAKHQPESQKTFTLEKVIAHSFHNQSKNYESDQQYAESSPQWSHKALNKLYNLSISRKESFKHPQSTPSYRHSSSNTQLFPKTEQNNMSLLNNFKIKESLEDLDRLKIFSVYFVKFNFDKVIKYSNQIVMKNIKNIVKSKTITRRLTQQSSNLLHNQLIHSPLRQNSQSFIFDSSNKPKQSQQSSNANILKSCEYLDDDLCIFEKQKQEFSGPNSVYHQTINQKKYNSKPYSKQQKQRIIQLNQQFRRKSLMVKSRSFLDYALKKYSASQDFNQDINQENASPQPKLQKLKSFQIDTNKFNGIKFQNLNKRRSSIESDLKSIKSVQENCSQADLEDQVDSTNIINIRSNNSRSIDLKQSLRRTSLPNNKIISLNLIKQTYKSSSSSSSSSSSQSSHESSPSLKKKLSQLSVSPISKVKTNNKLKKQDNDDDIDNYDDDNYNKNAQDDFNNQIYDQNNEQYMQIQIKNTLNSEKNSQ